MGILDNIFGSNSSDDDKYVLMVQFAFQLSASDGNAEEAEGQMMGAVLSNVPGMTPDRQKRIVDTALKNIENNTMQLTPEEAQSMSLNDKNDIVNALVAVSLADGHFHGEELAFIAMVGLTLGLDVEHLIGKLMENNDIEEKEVTAAFERIGKWMKENGYS